MFVIVLFVLDCGVYVRACASACVFACVCVRVAACM